MNGNTIFICYLDFYTRFNKNFMQELPLQIKKDLDLVK